MGEIADERWRAFFLISIAAGQLGLMQASASERRLRHNQY